MSKYEIMVIIDGRLKESDATPVITELKNILKSAKDLNVDSKMGLRDLAYPIKKINRGHYYVLTFSNDEPSEIKEFRRVASIKKEVLRQLIINLEKDYGYKATINPKKVAKSEFRKEKYRKAKENFLAEQEKIKREKDTTPVKLTDV